MRTDGVFVWSRKENGAGSLKRSRCYSGGAIHTLAFIVVAGLWAALLPLVSGDALATEPKTGETRKPIKFSDALPHDENGSNTHGSATRAATGTASSETVAAGSGSGSTPSVKVANGMQALKILSSKDLAGLLAQRIGADPEGTFNSFANALIGVSVVDIGFGVGLFPASKSIAEHKLQSAFASNYDPTLAELFDAIAEQTHSTWAYRPEGQFVKSDKPQSGQVGGFAVIEFAPAKRDLSYQVQLPTGWTSEAGTFGIAYGPGFPPAVSIFPQGRTSAGGAGPAGLEQLRLYAYQLSIDRGKKAKPDVKPSELGNGKVGPYDAVTFDTMVEPSPGQKVHVRQWVVVDPASRNVYFMWSTILPDMERELYPGVQELLRSFRVTSP